MGENKIKRSGPFGPYEVHRVRNEHTEKDLPAGKFCTGDPPKINEKAALIDGDVTCKKCLKVMADRLMEKALADPAQDKPAQDKREIQPIVIHCEHSANGHRSYAPLVIGQDHEPTLKKPLPSVWICFGDDAWYCGTVGTKKLRDYCDKVLSEGKVKNA
jgi:hypothetical protein